MEQIELFNEDPRMDQLPKDKHWAIYKNPTPYQAELNDMYFKINRILKNQERNK